jgi:hypothetical protein
MVQIAPTGSFDAGADVWPRLVSGSGKPLLMTKTFPDEAADPAVDATKRVRWLQRPV